MSDLDIKTKNILTALEGLIRRSSKEFDAQTHEQMMDTFIKHTTYVLEDYRSYKAGAITATAYSRALIKLAEVTLMAVKRLPG